MDTTQHTATAPHASARGVDDLLGYIGHVLGRLPRSSLCFITLRGKRMRAVARVDVPVPAPADEDARLRWAEAVARAVRSDRGADGCLLVVHEPGLDESVHRPLAPVLRTTLRTSGVPLVAAWCVDGGTAVAWTGEDEDIDVGADGEPSPVGAPELSAVSLALMTSEGSVWNAGAVGADVPTPAVDHDPWPLPPDDDEPSIECWLALWHRVLRGETAIGSLNRREAAAALALPLWRDRLLGMAAVGHSPSAGPDACPVDLFFADSGTAPRWDLLDRLHDQLRALVPDLPAEQAANALAVVGWIAWARGQGSQAGAHLEEAWRLCPGHGLTSLLLRLVDSGRVSGWASVPETAWRPAGRGPGEEPRRVA